MESSSSDQLTLEDRLTRDLAPELQVVRSMGKDRRTQVFLAREQALGRLVTIKVLGPEHTEDDTARARFEREAKAIASLAHPNVLQLYRYGTLSNGLPYLVIQHVKGRTLEEAQAARGRLDPSGARRILADTASALEAAHRQGIVHRDVRPGTIFLEEDAGRALLGDFGVAGILESARDDGPRLTRTGQVLGTPGYMSPELLRGDPLTAQADIYSLGVLGYEILSGKGPYRGESKRELLSAHLKDEPEPLRERGVIVDDDLAGLLRRCLAKEPGRRPTAGDVVRALSDEKKGGSGGADPGSDGVFRSMGKRRMLQWIGASAAVGWGLLEAVDQFEERELLPQILYPLTLATVITGIVATAVVAWFHGEKGDQSVHPAEIWILAALALGWIGACTWILIG